MNRNRRKAVRRPPTQRYASSRNRRKAPPTRTSKAGRVLAIIGGVLFIVGNIGARTGWVLLPFDRHHLLTQFGGAALAVLGLVLAGRR